MDNVVNIPFEELEQRFRKTLTRYAGWKIPGMGFDDVMQELRLVLWKAQRSYVEGAVFHPQQPRPASFRTFVLRAVKNRLGKLQYRESWTLKRGAVSVQDEDGTWRREPRHPLSLDQDGVDPEGFDTSPGAIEVLSELSGVAYDVAALVLCGETRERDWLRAGLTTDQVELAKVELRRHLVLGLGTYL